MDKANPRDLDLDVQIRFENPFQGNCNSSNIVKTCKNGRQLS